MIIDSVCPDFGCTTEAKMDSIEIWKNIILPITRRLNPNKATGSDEIFVQKLLILAQICNVNPNDYPAQWKFYNVALIYKKEDEYFLSYSYTQPVLETAF